MPLEISDEERRALATLVARLAGRDRRLAEHSLSCGALSATLSRMLELTSRQIAAASILGTLHEVGLLAPAGDAPGDATETATPESQRRLRRQTVALLSADPALARYAEPAGTLFDDFVPLIEAKIVVVADIYDALVRHMPGVAGLGKRGALNALSALAGSRIDPDVVHALVFSQRRSQRRIEVSA